MKYLYKEIESKCPFCNHNKGLLLYSVTSDVSAKHLMSRTDKRFNKLKKKIEELWKGSKCKKVKCSNCLVFYTSPFVAGDDELYTLVYSSKEKYPSEREDYNWALEQLNKIKKDKSFNLLEIGSGSGAFLKKVPSQIVNKKNLHASEVSLSGSEELRKMGIKNYSNIYEDKINEKFSVVCSFNTIEHLDNIHRFFFVLSKILKKGGHLFLSTHTQQVVSFYETKGVTLDLPPIHISCWNEKTFDVVGKIYGFELVNQKLLALNFFRNIVNFGIGTFELRSLNDNSIESFIRGIKYKKLRKFFTYIYLFALSPYFIISSLGKKIYSSQFVHLRKL
jgi:SAM-dependent methyltransferase